MKQYIKSIITLVLIAFSSNVIVHAQKITIDAKRTISKTADQVGCWLNTNQSSNNSEFEDLLRELKIKSLRFGWQYSIMDSADNSIFRRSPCDPNIQSNLKGADCVVKERINIFETDSLLKNLNISGFAVLSTDGVNYTGTADIKLAAMSASQREDFYIQNAIRYATWAKNHNVTYFEVGNENDLPGEMVDFKLGARWTAAQYGAFALKMAKAVKTVAPNIKCGINGGFNSTDERKKWWKDIANNAPEINKYIDFIVVHKYAFGLSYTMWNSSTTLWGGVNSDIITSISELFPGKPVYITEIGGFPQESGKVEHYRALINLEMLMSVFRDTIVKHVIHWPDRWGDNGAINQSSNKLNVLGNGLAAYTRFSKPILTDFGASENVTYSVARDSDKNSLTVWLVNHNDNSKITNITINNFEPAGENELWTLTSPKDDPTATTNELKKLGTIKYITENGATKFKISLNATSATIITFNSNTKKVPQALKIVTNALGNEVYVSFNQELKSANDTSGISIFSEGKKYELSKIELADNNILRLTLKDKLIAGKYLYLKFVNSNIFFNNNQKLDSITILPVVNNTKSYANAPMLEKAVTNAFGNYIYLTFSKELKPLADKDVFSIRRDGEMATINSITPDTVPLRWIIGLMKSPSYNDLLTVSYTGNKIESMDNQPLEVFQDFPVINMAIPPIPVQTIYGNGRMPWPINDGSLIQAEDYDQGGEGLAFHDYDNKDVNSATNIRIADAVDIYEATDKGVNGFVVGNCNNGEWLEYTVSAEAGDYFIDARCALDSESAKIDFLINDLAITSVIALNTGSMAEFQSFRSDTFHLNETAKATLRILVNSNVYLNYFQFNQVQSSSVQRAEKNAECWFFPNPANNMVNIISNSGGIIELVDVSGQKVLTNIINNHTRSINIAGIKPGVYIIKLKQNQSVKQNILIKK